MIKETVLSGELAVLAVSLDIIMMRNEQRDVTAGHWLTLPTIAGNRGSFSAKGVQLGGQDKNRFFMGG